MKFFNWQSKSWRERMMLVLTLVLVVVLASHPELRLFLPLLDALGLDLLLLLISAQALDYVRPLAVVAFRTILRPMAVKLYQLLLFFFGIMGPYVDARIATNYHSRIAARL